MDASPRRPARPDPKGQPVHLRSADLDLDLPIRPVGVTKNGDMELPDTVTEVGWYRFGPYPSATRGTAVLAAHVDTRSEGLGPFVRLRDARPGDVVTVRDKGGRDRDFRIADVVSLSKQRIEWDQVFDRRGATRLVLITCGGPYDQRSGYRDNVLATAFPTT